MSNRYKTIMVDGVRKLEHVAIWEEKYGPKPEGCDIHHKNGDPLDNRLENLELMTKADHMRLHREGKLSGTDVVDATDPKIIEDRKKKCEYARAHRLAHHEEAVKKDHEYHMKNGDKIRSHAKEWYQENWREIREQQRQYELAHKDERAKRNAEYYAAHTEERKEYWKRHRLENLEEIKRKQREHRAAHADEIKAKAAVMRAERRAYLAAKQRLYVAKRDGKGPEVIAACEAKVAEEKAKLTFKR